MAKACLPDRTELAKQVKELLRSDVVAVQKASCQLQCPWQVWR